MLSPSNFCPDMCDLSGNMAHKHMRLQTDNENEAERSVGREETIQNIINSRRACARHQIDLKRAVEIEHDPRRHEVLFDGVRFMLVGVVGTIQNRL
jgi:hypothetical protein